MNLVSTDFEDQEILPIKFTCRGENVCPKLIINGIPPASKSLCIIMHDPDAVGGDFTHWLVWNLPTAITAIERNTLPISAVEGKNDFGKNEYGGPCPPPGSGTHHYVFELYALDSELDLPRSTDQMNLRNAIKESVIDQAVIVGIVETNNSMERYT